MLKHLKWRISLLLCIYPLIAHVQPTEIQIKGIDRDVLQNVQRRLSELYQAKSIMNEQDITLRNQIKQAMSPYGLFNPQVEVRRSKGNITFQISKGPQTIITHFKAELIGEGRLNPRLLETLHTIPLKTGQPLNSTVYEDAKEALKNKTEQLGYLHATFKKSILWIDEQQNSASIHLIFDTGPQFYFGQIRFHPTYLSPKLLHRFVPFQWGQPYSEEQLDELNSNLAASGYFKTVKVKPKINNDTQVPVDIDLKPSKRVTYSLGAGYGTDTGPRGLAELHVIPVNRSGHKFNAILQGSFEENALQAQYLIPGKNPVVDNYGINGGITNLDYNAGHSTSELLSLAQQHVLTTHQRILSLNALHDRYSYYGQNPMEESLFYPKALFSWNHTSDPQFSPSGFNVSIMGLVANKALFSDITMGQLTLDAKAALTIDPIRTRLYFHTIQGTTNIHNIYQIPLSLAQLLGGATNLRGYNFNEVGPGRVISYAGAELQKETFNKWYALGFFDSGKVYNPQVSTYKYDAGVGVMWVSPVGPIKVAVAQAVNQQMGRQTGQSPKLVVMMGTDL